MRGLYFCDVCSIEFPVDTNDACAVCPSCNEDVLAVNDGFAEPVDLYEPDTLDPSEIAFSPDEASFD